MSAAVEVDKPLPSFPLRYRGVGRFRHAEIPSFQLVLKQLGPFEFYDHFGVSLEVENAPAPAYFKLPQICKHL